MKTQNRKSWNISRASANVVRLSRKERREKMKQYRRGLISQEELIRCGIDCKGFDFLYSQFRLGGLSRVESCYNALFIRVLHRFDQSEKKISRELKNTYSHPNGWYKDSFYTWRNNLWSHILTFLQRFPVFYRNVCEFFVALPDTLRSSHDRHVVHMDNSFRSFVSFCRGLSRFGRILVPLAVSTLLLYPVHAKLERTVALDIYVNGDYVGTVSNGDVLVNTQHMLEKNLSASIGDTFRFTDDITYHFTHEKDASYLSESEVYSALYGAAKQHIRSGYGLYVDDVLIVASENKAALEKAVDDIKDYYKKQTEFYAEGEDIRVRYANTITILSRDFSVDQLSDETEIRKLLGLKPIENERANPKDAIYTLYYETLKSRADEQKLKLTGGKQNLTGVATFAGVDDETDVLSSNESVGLGQTVDVTLDYVITKPETVEEALPFETAYVESDEYRLGIQKVMAQGKDGYRRAVYDVSYRGGEEIGRERIDEEVLIPSEDRIVYVGTREPTEEELATMATGTFIIPYDNYLSSAYGIRTISDFGSKDFHPAWDIPGPYGNDVAASDGGIVTSVGYTSGYGLHVIVDHENGYETLYAHLSKSKVKVGQRVAQGDCIAAMGSSGRVTGVHVHFEIRKDGATVDPADFLGEVEVKY